MGGGWRNLVTGCELFSLLGEVTPPKTNMEPENGPFKEEIPIGNPPFSGSMLNFGDGNKFSFQKKVVFGQKPWTFLGVQKKLSEQTLEPSMNCDISR